jgi:hypothetical protein
MGPTITPVRMPSTNNSKGTKSYVFSTPLIMTSNHIHRTADQAKHGHIPVQ